MKIVNRIHAVKQLNTSGGKIFSATFIKKDGTVRTINARIGVAKNVKGIGLKYDPHKYGLLSVYDLQKDDYRFVNIGTLQSYKIGGEVYQLTKELLGKKEVK